MAIEYKNGVRSWDLHGHSLQHFDGDCERPDAILKAMRKWIKDNNIAPARIYVDSVYNTESERWEYTGTVEWASVFGDSVV